MEKPILQMSEVTKKYGDYTVLSQLSLSVNPGEVVVVWDHQAVEKVRYFVVSMD